MEEELPPGFWEEAQAPNPPGSSQQRQVRVEPDRQPREEVSAVPGESDRSSAGIDDPAFETLQALFPGRILSIEAGDEAADEEVAAAPGDAAEDEEEA